MKKVVEKVVRGSFVGPPLGTLRSPNCQKTDKPFEKQVAKHCAPSAAQEVSRVAPNFKMIVSSRRNHHFHIPTSTGMASNG